MSASREKKNRTAPVEKAVEQKKRGKSFFMAIGAVVLAVLIIVAIVVFKGPFFFNHGTALTVNGESVSPITVRYFYTNEFSNIMSSYSSMFGEYASTYLSSIFEDPSHAENTVMDTETGETYGSYIMNLAKNDIAEAYAIYKDAQAAGFTLPEDYESELSNNASMYEFYASYYGVSTDTFMKGNFGKGASLDSYMDYCRLCATVSAYEEFIRDGFEFTASELSAAYAKDPSDYNSYNFYTCYVAADYDSDADEDTIAAAMEEAESIAAAIASDAENGEEAYLAAVEANSYTNSPRYNCLKSNISSVYSEWVLDTARKAGDVSIFEASSGWYVVYYLSCDTNDYATKNARVIVLNADANDDGTLDWTTAEENLASLQADYAAGEAGEDLFSKLAATYSDDSNTNANGGKYENISKGQLDDDVNDWLYASSRKVGDTAVIRLEDSVYWVYYEGDGENYRSYLVEAALRQDAFEAWHAAYENVEAPVENKFGMRYVDRTLAYSAS